RTIRAAVRKTSEAVKGEAQADEAVVAAVLAGTEAVVQIVLEAVIVIISAKHTAAVRTART
ncbi:MAG TPA: hypothetical protein VFM80_00845, partial [Gracilimonas sp.]|uniref:hypothetical protein n=1 Tax=Gracilimonas sp. TaxID=1974203 RepID=UPI002DA82A99|nr:hypothetical protein [Gracilimonas sp.]